jgi:uncharacterized membrane protein
LADLIVVKFDQSYGAQEALSAIRALQELRYAWIDDIAIVEKHKTGITTISSPHGSVSGGAFLGGLAGLLLFWWFPPAWFFGGWLGGMGVGAIIGELMKKSGLDENLIKEIKEELTPGTSALVLVGAKADVDQMRLALEPYHPAKIIRTSLSDDTVAALKEALEEQKTES